MILRAMVSMESSYTHGSCRGNGGRLSGPSLGGEHGSAIAAVAVLDMAIPSRAAARRVTPFCVYSATSNNIYLIHGPESVINKKCKANFNVKGKSKVKSQESKVPECGRDAPLAGGALRLNSGNFDSCLLTFDLPFKQFIEN